MTKICARRSRLRVAWFFAVVAVVTVLVAVVWPRWGANSAPGWTTPTNISHSTYGAFGPESVIDLDGYTHVVWYGNGATNTDWSIWYTNNRAGGTWATPKKITTGQDLRFPKIAIDSADGLHVVYEDRGVEDIMYLESTDHGTTWSYKLNISNSSGKGYEPDVYADPEGNIHAVWIDNRWTSGPQYQVAYSKRTAGSWSTPVRVQTKVGFNKAPRVTTTGSGAGLSVHVAFYGKSADTDPNYMYEMYYVRGTGTSWGTPANLSKSPSDASYTPDIARPVGTTTDLYIVWDETPPGGYHDIYLIRSTDNGTTWSSPLPITLDAALSRFPAIVYAQNRAQVVYDTDAAGDGDIFYSNYDPSSGTIITPINLSENSSTSKEADILADECRLAVSWMDKGTNWDIMYSTTPTTPPAPCTPPLTPVPTTPSGNVQPYGSVSMMAQSPPGDQTYTNQPTITLSLTAASPIGALIANMRICNQDACDPLPSWIPFADSVANWRLQASSHSCSSKTVQAWFQDDQGRESESCTDQIFYDDYLEANMVLNEGSPYTNRTMVMVNSDDRDLTTGCSGLAQMRLSENGITYTTPMPFYSRLYYFLSPYGPSLRTVYVEYEDHAGNVGIYNDSIILDTTPPWGTAPTLPGSTTDLSIPVSGLQGFDDVSGVANVWLANRADGPWLAMTYVAPPHDYTWNLAYGGPPAQVQPVYVMYEDGSGYGSFPGNLSPVYSATITVSGISNAFLPYTAHGGGGLASAPGPVLSEEVGLILQADPQQAGPGQEVLLYLAARREQATPLEGTLRIVLPTGLRVLGAWSAYGQLLQVGEHEVVSREWASSRQVPWVLVRAQVEEGVGATLQVQGDMTWSGGAATAAPVPLRPRD